MKNDWKPEKINKQQKINVSAKSSKTFVRGRGCRIVPETLDVRLVWFPFGCSMLFIRVVSQVVLKEVKVDNKGAYHV